MNCRMVLLQNGWVMLESLDQSLSLHTQGVVVRQDWMSSFPQELNFILPIYNSNAALKVMLHSVICIRDTK